MANLGSSVSMFKKVTDTEFSYQIMYVCTSAKKFFCDVLIIGSGIGLLPLLCQAITWTSADLCMLSALECQVHTWEQT